MIMVPYYEPALIIENQRARVGTTLEIEHAENRACDLIERSALIHRRGRRINIAETPVVLDEGQARGLVNRDVIDEVLPRPRRNHQEWQAHAIAAAGRSQGGAVGGIAADSRGGNESRIADRRRWAQRRDGNKGVIGVGAAIVRAGAEGRVTDNGSAHVIIPTVAVVPADDDRRVLTLIRFLQH